MKRASIPALCAAILIGGCTADSPGSPAGPVSGAPPGGECVAAAGTTAVGRTATLPLADQVRTATGSRTVRIMEPGKAYTMEFDPGRVNLVVDRNRIVQEVRCG